MSVPTTIGLILAGGLSRRMGGGDKALARLGGITLLERVTARLAPQVARLLVSANGDPARLGTTLDIVPDDLAGHPGPLAGILAGLDRIAADPAAEWMLSAPADSPFLPHDLVARLHAGRGDAPIVHAASSGRAHYVVALWHVALRRDLRATLESGDRRVWAFGARHGAVAVEWPAEPADPFLNVNTPEDLDAAARLLAAHPGL